MADHQAHGGAVEFSKSSRYLCHSDSNGVVKIWDAITGSLKQEYAPSSHLSVQCTCISWSPICESTAAFKNRSPKKKKRKVEDKKIENECELIALGSTDGSILLYNVNEADVHSQLSGGHGAAVTSVCWSADGSKLYSCSDDEHIIEWEVNTSSVINKWKSSHGKLTSLTLCHSQEHLLTANRSIHLWDLKTRKVIQTFVGHTTEVMKLCEVPCTKQINNCNNSMDHDGQQSVEGNYVVSMARGENKISVRQITSSKRSAELLASFSVTEEPIMMDIHLPDNDKQTVQMVVVTRYGKVAYYESVLNGRQKKPLKAKQVMTVMTKEAGSERSLPVVASAFNVGDGSICFVYEDFIVPIFEFMPPNDLQNQLVRRDPRVLKLTAEKSSKRGFVQREEKEVASIPGKKIKIDEMALGERLSAEEKMMEARPDAKTVMANSSAILLAQGLRSQNKKVLNAVLQKNNPVHIRTTVSELPKNLLQALAVELQRRMMGHHQSGKVAGKWMKCVISMLGSDLSSLQMEQKFLEPFAESIEAPVSRFSKIFQLRGKLEGYINKPTIAESQSNERTESFFCEINHNDLTTDGYRADTNISEDEWEEDDSAN